MGRTNRRAARTDDNQKSIVEGLRAYKRISVVTGMDDILVGFKGETFWFEIKNPDTVSTVTGEVRPSSVKAGQRELKASWQGHYDIVTTLAEILHKIGWRESDGK